MHEVKIIQKRLPLFNAVSDKSIEHSFSVGYLAFIFRHSRAKVLYGRVVPPYHPLPPNPQTP